MNFSFVQSYFIRDHSFSSCSTKDSYCCIIIIIIICCCVTKCNRLQNCLQLGFLFLSLKMITLDYMYVQVTFSRLR